MTNGMGAVKARKRVTGSAVANPSLLRIAMLFIGLVMLALALPPFFNFPWLGFWLVPLAAIYLLLLLLLPRLWLVVLPLATVGLDLTPFTGRFVYSELDLLFVVTLASGLIFNRYRYKVFAPGPATFALFLYLGVIALGYSGWLFLVQPPGAHVDNPYYTSAYPYRVLKGIVWGVALVPMWGDLLAVDKRRAVNTLVAGMSGAALLLGLIVLWESGALRVLSGGPVASDAARSLQHLFSSYRITGLFTDMHTGGEAFDGVVLLLLPAALYGATYGRTAWLRLLGAVAIVALACVTLVGFSQAAGATFAAALIVYAALTLRARRRNGLSLPFPIMALITASVAAIMAAVFAYRFAGAYGLLCYGALLLLACARAPLGQVPSWTRHLVTVLAVGLVGLAVKAHIGRAGAGPSSFGAVWLGISLAASYLCTVWLLVKMGSTTRINRLLLLSGMLTLPVVFALAVGNHTFDGRVASGSGDPVAKGEHWRAVIDSSGTGLLRGLLGNGVGSFPASYIGSHPQIVREVGSFSVIRKDLRHLLRLSGGAGLLLGQRVTVEPYTDYTVKIYLAAEQPARLVISLCERNVIYASGFVPNCARESIDFEATDGEVKEQVLQINSGQIGEKGILWRWPTLMTIQFENPGSVVEIDAVDLSADGFNELRNSSFKHGLDYWFFYNDISQLPWHTENIFLQSWFESGWLGLCLLLALIALLVRASLERRAHDSLLPVYATAVLCLGLFGLAGGPLDSARVSWLFYFFLAAGLAKLRVRGKGAHTVAAKGVP